MSNPEGKKNNVHNLAAIHVARQRGRWLNLVLARDDLTASEKNVAAVIANKYVNPKFQGRCWAGQRAIAAAAGLSERTVRSALKRLQECGLIRIDRHGKRQRDDIFLMMPVENVTGNSEDEEGQILTEVTGNSSTMTGKSSTVTGNSSVVTGNYLPVQNTPNPTPYYTPHYTPCPGGEERKEEKSNSNGEEGKGHPVELDKLVRRGIDESQCRIFIGIDMAYLIGDYGPTQKRIRGERVFISPPKVDGKCADQLLLDRTPPQELARLIDLNMRGVLRQSDLAAVIAPFADEIRSLMDSQSA